jgi:hypothetical protein
MQHRQLDHQNMTLVAIDDVIDRGRKEDWLELRRSALAERLIMEDILQLCQARLSDPEADIQRYSFWRLYAERHLA